MRVPEAPDLGTLPRPPPPVLILGEKTQGFLSVKSIPPRTDEQSLCGAFSAMRLKTLLYDSVFPANLFTITTHLKGFFVSPDRVRSRWQGYLRSHK